MKLEVEMKKIPSVTFFNTIYFEAQKEVSAFHFYSNDASETMVDLYLTDVKVELDDNKKISRVRGNKRYEMVDHLSNVLATVTDRKRLTTESPELMVVSTGYEGGDEPYFRTNDYSGQQVKASQNNHVFEGTYSIMLTGVNGDQYGPTLFQKVKPTDVVTISCETWWENVGATMNRGGGIAYYILDDVGNVLTDANGNNYWQEMTIGLGGLGAGVWEHQATSYPVPPNLYKKVGSTVTPYTGEVTFIAFPWNASGTNVTHYDKMTITIDRSAHPEYVYEAEIMTVTDYYGFGMPMPGRTFNRGDHDYGYQNQLTDDELWEGSVSYKYRIEDARIGRFFSVDPLASKYPYNSTYAFSENRVFDGVELEGLEFSGNHSYQYSPSSENECLDCWKMILAPDGKYYYFESPYILITERLGSSGNATLGGKGNYQVTPYAVISFTDGNNDYIAQGKINKNTGTAEFTEYKTPWGTGCNTCQEHMIDGYNLTKAKVKWEINRRIMNQMNEYGAKMLLSPLMLMGGAAYIGGGALFETSAATALTRSSIDFGAQLLVNKGDFKKVDYFDVAASGIFTARLSALSGSILDFRPAEGKVNIALINKDFSSFAIDLGAKTFFGGGQFQFGNSTFTGATGTGFSSQYFSTSLSSFETNALRGGMTFHLNLAGKYVSKELKSNF